MFETFWMVLGRGVPTYRHDTEESARDEAERLARLNPNEEFYVLQAIGKCQRRDVDWAIPSVPVPF